MNCTFHPEREAAYRCNICGQLVCKECSVVIEQRVSCVKCAAEALNAYAGEKEVARAPKTAEHNTNWFGVFLLACLIPGAGHMFMGLMKRGLFLMSAFFLSIVIVSSGFLSGILWALIPIVYLGGIFDALNIRKQILKNGFAYDDISGAATHISRFRVPIAIFILLAAFSNSSLNYALNMFFIPCALVCVAAYIFAKGRRGHRND